MAIWKNWAEQIYLKLKHRGKHIQLSSTSKVSRHSIMEGYNGIGKNSFFSGQLGYASYLGENCHIVANVGRYCSIASRVVTVRGSHPTKDWVSTHPAFFSTAKQCGMTFVSEDKFVENKPPITIGNDVWIGDSALLMDGIAIGDGAIIAAGAVVTKNVEPYSVVAGVPAREIRKRFSEETIEKLLASQWWNKSPEWLREHASQFCCEELIGEWRI